ncbi:MAG: DoxX family protein [Planctomycetia bacterium]|nr:DoxX family protein [Planctomycetia bacterium]
MSVGTPIGPPFWMKLLGESDRSGLDRGLLILQVVFGTLLIIGCGLPKLQNCSLIIEKGFLDPFGLGFSKSLTVAILCETIFAALVVAGLLTSPPYISLIITMSLAAFVAHASDLMFLPSFPSEEPALLYLIVFASIFCMGPGRFSIDGVVALPRKER